MEEGTHMHELATRLFPIARSLTGEGVRETLKILKESIPLTIHEVPSGTKVFDWEVPKEWNITAAWIRDSKGKTIVDFSENNLHVVGYSTAIDARLSLAELQEHLYSIPEKPDAIPYVTSYYQERWGFCMTDRARKKLSDDTYHVFIDSTLGPGSLTYGELILPGASNKEVFLSTYLCHPSMANNELSGPVVTTELATWLMNEPRRYTYRIVFIPETIGSLTYLAKNLDAMKKNIVAGFNITCVGDDRAYSYLPSRSGTTRADYAALRVLQARHPDFIRYSYLDRGSDERQYCSPGIDLPVATVMRSKYGEYPEYHTSLDDLQVVTPTGLQGGYNVLKECIEWIENHPSYTATCLGEPQLGKRGMYQTLSRHGSVDADVQLLLNVLAYADGQHDTPTMAQLFNIPESKVSEAVDALLKAGLIIDS
jgi:aminopeptidase-like protein